MTVTVINTLAYYINKLIKAVKSFITVGFNLSGSDFLSLPRPGPNVIELFTVVIYECS